MPRIGTSRSATSAPPCSSVPSPPSTTSRSIGSASSVSSTQARSNGDSRVADDDRFVPAGAQPGGQLGGDLHRLGLGTLEQEADATHATSLIHFG